MQEEKTVTMEMERGVLAMFTKTLLEATSHINKLTDAPDGMSVEEYRQNALQDIISTLELIKNGCIMDIQPMADGQVKFSLHGKDYGTAAVANIVDNLWRESGVVRQLYGKTLEWYYHWDKRIADVYESIGKTPPPPPAPAPPGDDNSNAPQVYIKAGMHIIQQAFKLPAQGSFDFTASTKEDEWYDRIKPFAHTRPLAEDKQLRPEVAVAGYKLTLLEQQVMEVVLSLFSQNDYRGDMSYTREEYVDKVLPVWNEDKPYMVNKLEAYTSSTNIPIIKTTQAEILRRMGYNTPSQHDIQRVREALIKLTTQQYYFSYRRLEHDKNGRPAINKKTGKYAMANVEEVSTLIRLKNITPEEGERSYLEIHPSPAMLDQVTGEHGGNYFLLIPTEWRKEVQRKIRRKPGIYEERFMMWCRVEVEKIRRHNNNAKRRSQAIRPYTKEVTWQEVAETLRMPESLRKANKARARKLVEAAYNTAVKVGYLTDVKHSTSGTTIHYNPDFYPFVEGTVRD